MATVLIQFDPPHLSKIRLKPSQRVKKGEVGRGGEVGYFHPQALNSKLTFHAIFLMDPDGNIEKMSEEIAKE
ncbi:hypothetical protein TNCV_301051 [Trichonephila clavipes]|nr:hypothetical protein TNCV_301051 [Trichonephila clavipes]